MSRRASRFPWLIALVVVIIGAWYWFAPRRAWDHFLRALVTADAPALERVVDFPRVRDHLKSDLRVALDTRRGQLPQGVAPAIGGVVLDPLVDMVISPAGLEQLVSSFSSRDADVAQHTVTSFRHRSLSRVDVHVRSSVDPESAAGVFTFERSGISWRLTRVWSDRLVSSAEGS